MHSNSIVGLVLLGSTLALAHTPKLFPRGNLIHNQLHKVHKPSGDSGDHPHDDPTGKYPFSTGDHRPVAPIPTGTGLPNAGHEHGGAFHNSTTTTSYSTVFITSTSVQTVYANETPAVGEASATISADQAGASQTPASEQVASDKSQSGNTQPEKAQPVEDKNAANEQDAAGQCGAVQTVTVPGNQVTVTVTAAAAVVPTPPADSGSGNDNQAESPASANTSPLVVASSSSSVADSKTPVAGSPVSATPASSSSPAAEQQSQSASSSTTGNTATAPAQSLTASSAAPINTAQAPQGGKPFKTKRGIIASGHSMDQLAKAMGVGQISWLGNW